MSENTLQSQIEDLWERRETLSAATGGEARRVVAAVLDALDSGAVRVAEPGPSGWQVNQWLKKAVLLSFGCTTRRRCRAPAARRCSTRSQ